MPKDLSPSALAVWKQTTRAMGSPQNKEESPRTNRPNERNSSSLGAGSGIADEDGGWWVEDGSEQPTVIIHSRFSILWEMEDGGGLPSSIFHLPRLQRG